MVGSVGGLTFDPPNTVYSINLGWPIEVFCLGEGPLIWTFNSNKIDSDLDLDVYTLRFNQNRTKLAILSLRDHGVYTCHGPRESLNVRVRVH